MRNIFAMELIGIFLAVVILIVITFFAMSHKNNSKKEEGNTFKYVFWAILGMAGVICLIFASKAGYSIRRFYRYKNYKADFLLILMIVLFIASIFTAITSIIKFNKGDKDVASKYIIISIATLLGYVSIVLLGKNDYQIIILSVCPTIIVLFETFIGSFVYYDAKKRGMDAWMWTVVSVFVPNFIGIIIYFISRGNNAKKCFSCGKPINNEYKVCPYCGTTLNQSCPNCGKNVSPDWLVCPYCSHTLK